MILRGTVDGVDRVVQDEFVLLCFGSGDVGRVFQGAELGLEFGIGIDNEFQGLADVVFAVDVGVDVVVQLVVEKLEVVEQVMRLFSAVFGLGVISDLLQFDQSRASKLQIEGQSQSWLPARVAYLTDLRLSQGIAMPLREAESRNERQQ